ncbi:hypothetical protein SAMN05428942_7310 [Streptomyces sp. 2112.2]|nr:hypothetical protein SAMN05428942_7310 [Streptomyces sp. 2112.2]
MSISLTRRCDSGYTRTALPPRAPGWPPVRGRLRHGGDELRVRAWFLRRAVDICTGRIR